MKKILKIILALSLVLSMFSPLLSFAANSEASETMLLDLKNVNVDSNNTYIHEIEAPKDFGALINYTFNVTGHSKATLTKVDYIQASNKLQLTFTLADGGLKTVKGYETSEKRQYNQYLGHAVCRYSDGVRWQVNHIGANNEYKYDIYDFSKEIPNGKVPYDFYYDKITAKGKFTADMSITPAYWVDDKGTVYTNSQIVSGTKTVVEGDIEYPNNMNIERLTYSEKQKGIVNPYQYFKFRMIDFNDVGKKYEGTFIVQPYVASANEKMVGYAYCTQYSFKVFYNFTAKAKANDITGTFTYRYETSEEPKVITTITAEPSKVKFQGKAIEVKVTLKAEVINVKQPAMVSGYKLFLRTEDNTQNPQPSGYERPGNTLTTQTTATFTIPTSKLNDKSSFTEYFVGRSYAYLSNGKTLMSDLAKTSTYVYKDEPIEEEEHDIVAKINGNSVVKKGDNTTFNAYGSYSTGSTIEGIMWYLEKAKIQPSDSYVAGQYSFTTWYDELGTKQALVQVIDKEGRQAWDSMSFEVVEPTIETRISHTGTVKENRKVTFNATHDTPSRYPLSEITWNVESLNGDLDSHIRHEPDLTGQQSIDVLFKKAGEYVVTAHTKNTAGYEYEAIYIVEIVEDKTPFVDFDFQQKIYRDPSNQNLATFEFIDYSYSYDGDYIQQRNWYVIFDSNNDGLFQEQAVLFNTGNNRQVTYASNRVGKYKFILEAIEEFGEPTIAQFVTESDRRRNSTSGW